MYIWPGMTLWLPEILVRELTHDDSGAMDAIGVGGNGTVPVPQPPDSNTPVLHLPALGSRTSAMDLSNLHALSASGTRRG